MKFTGDLYAIQDGEIVYPNEPIITIKAPLIQAKILETPILNIMNMNLGIATKDHGNKSRRSCKSSCFWK